MFEKYEIVKRKKDDKAVNIIGFKDDGILCEIMIDGECYEITLKENEIEKYAQKDLVYPQ